MSQNVSCLTTILLAEGDGRWGGGAEDQDQALLTKSSLDISLVPESEDDKKLAALYDV